MFNLPLYNSELLDCKSCSLIEESNPVSIDVIRPGTDLTPMLVISEKPSPEEVLLTKGYKDRHNLYLRKLLSEYLPKFTIFLTYLVKCGFSGTYTKKKGKTCVDLWINGEIVELQPKFILTLGEAPYNYCIKHWWGCWGNEKENKLKDKVGQLVKRPDGVWGVGFYSSSYLFERGYKVERQFVNLLEKIRSINV